MTSQNANASWPTCCWHIIGGKTFQEIMVKATRCRQGVWLCNTLWCKRLVCVFDHSMLRCQTSLFLGYKKAVTGWYRLALSRVSATDGKLIFPSNNISSVHTFIVSDTGPDKSMGSDLEVKVKRQNLYDLHCLSYLHHKAKPDCIAKISHIICITVCIWGGEAGIWKNAARKTFEALFRLH